MALFASFPGVLQVLFQAHGRTRLNSIRSSRYATAYLGGLSPHLLTAFALNPKRRANSAFVTPARANNPVKLILSPTMMYHHRRFYTTRPTAQANFYFLDR